MPDNGYGLYDMTGNVWRCTQGWYAVVHGPLVPGVNYVGGRLSNRRRTAHTETCGLGHRSRLRTPIS